MEYDEGAIGYRFEVCGGEVEVIIEVVVCGEGFFRVFKAESQGVLEVSCGGVVRVVCHRRDGEV